MSRALWFAAGAGAGVWAMVKGRRAAEAVTPEGLEDRWAGIQRGWQVFTDEVRAGMAERETELRERMLLGAAGRPELPAAGNENEQTRGRDEH